MVLWELTLATAYFLGLRRTYRLALKIQRKLISPRRTRIRQFAHRLHKVCITGTLGCLLFQCYCPYCREIFPRRTRAVFDVAIKVHQNIQERDLEVGRNLGNRLLRWLDRMKPSAEIRPKPPQDTSASSTAKKQLTNSTHQTTSSIQRNGVRTEGQQSDRHFFTSSRNIWSKSLPIVSKMLRPTKPAGMNTQYRHLSIYCPRALSVNSGGFGYRGVIREDILQLMLRH